MTTVQELLAEARDKIDNDPTWRTDPQDGEQLNGVSRLKIHCDEWLPLRIRDQHDAIQLMTDLILNWPTSRTFTQWHSASEWVDNWPKFVRVQVEFAIAERLEHEFYLEGRPDARHLKRECAYCVS